MSSTPKHPLKYAQPRVPSEGPPKYLHKLESWFVEFAHLFKEGAKPRAADPKRLAEVGQTQTGRSRPPVQRPPVAALPEWPRTVGQMCDLLSQLPDAQFTQVISAMKGKMPEEALGVELNEALPNVLSLLKYQTTMPELLWRETQGDWKAARQVVEIADLYNRWIHEQLPPGGGRFKTNPRHNLLMLYGLAGGLQKLTGKELVDFFDSECPCGETHNQRVLERLRAKLLRRLCEFPRPLPASANLAFPSSSAALLDGQGTVPAGTEIVVTLNQSVSSKDVQTSQTIAGRVAEDVTEGKTVIPKGSNAMLSVASVQSSGSLRGVSRLWLKINSVEVNGKTYTVSSRWSGQTAAASLTGDITFPAETKLCFTLKTSLDDSVGDSRSSTGHGQA